MRGKWTGNNSSNNRIQIDSAWREGYLRNDWKGEKGLSGLSAIVHSVEARPRAISTVPRQRIASFRSFTIDSFGPRFVPLCARRYLRANHSSCADARRARAVNLIPKQETLSLFSLSLSSLCSYRLLARKLGNRAIAAGGVNNPRDSSRVSQRSRFEGSRNSVEQLERDLQSRRDTVSETIFK